MRRPLRSDEARAVANVAIDLGDPGRMAKARRLHRSNGVGSVDIEPGKAHASVVDSNGEIHDVELTVVSPPASGAVPSASDLLTSCSCDDDGDSCMHALAALLGVAEEIESNGRLLEIWTGTVPSSSAPSYAAPTGDAESFFAGAWGATPDRLTLGPHHSGQPPVLVVDDIDAGEVVVDARRAIASGLSRYRARS